MTVVYSLTPELRIKLKEPFGRLIEGSFEETMSKMKVLVEKEKPPKIISVGDVVSRNLHMYGINPQLTIVDNKSLRVQIIPEKISVKKTVHVNNPQGTITEEAIAAIKKALNNDEHVHIVIEGEEDLLVLIAVLYAPDNAFVVYGQPYTGVVVVKVSSENKALTQKFLNSMKPSKS